ncbi:Transposase DDE domain protein [Maioricimonas rarisocia]|uniref:Transposase DDE domain protein n=1 Tax=Maioricimonas rarisocia TaxID=2528026 RepID=A0A517Z3H2_9PLAN|nr:IS4 family transposase [Maioricimonas rarisocia]QDU36977.1 Transposase DDE domain protein [Maioricimonas rarisocia]QDU39768.1 Transposase DDE domain protein [Maioricimonas rarisocia]
MLGSDVLDRFVDEAPVCVMVRACLENILAPQRLDQLFREHSETQYERELTFSSLVELMSLVVCRIEPTVHAAFQRKKESMPVSVKALYDKLSGVEPQVSQALVRHIAQGAGNVMANWNSRTPLLKGYHTRVIDGNHITGTDHRLKELREDGAAALPGVAVAVLDPDRGLIEDVLVAEDAYTQEVKLAAPIFEQVQPKDLIIADRHYCTSGVLFGIKDRDGCFLMRQHMGHLRWELIGERRCKGPAENGLLYEQTMQLTDPDTGKRMEIRRITLELDKPVRGGDTELHLLTNLPPQAADAEQVAALYRKRWTIETAFQHITTSLCCELNTLGFPRAALFSFCMAVACFNVFALVPAAMAHVHGHEWVDDNVSLYYLTEELSGTYRGMMIALPPEEWSGFRELPALRLAETLVELVGRAKLSRYQKHKRKSKKRSRREYAPKKHVSTAQKLKARAAKKSAKKKTGKVKRKPPT